jgi:hypothetical protein
MPKDKMSVVFISIDFSKNIICLSLSESPDFFTLIEYQGEVPLTQHTTIEEITACIILLEEEEKSDAKGTVYIVASVAESVPWPRTLNPSAISHCPYRRKYHS